MQEPIWFCHRRFEYGYTCRYKEINGVCNKKRRGGKLCKDAHGYPKLPPAPPTAGSNVHTPPTVIKVVIDRKDKDNA